MMKENNGRGAAQRRLVLRKLAIVGSVILATFLFVCVQLASSSSGASDLERLDSNKWTRSTSTNHRHLKRTQRPNDAMISPTLFAHGITRENLNLILNAKVHLVDLHMDLVELRRDLSNEPYAGIYGTFCRVDWPLHKADPSTYPMFRDLLDHSSECNEAHRIHKVDIRALANQARYYDEQAAASAGEDASVHALDVTAFVFHESRCGSTLTANLLAAMNPAQHRVYSEAPPPMKALFQICGEDYSVCSKETAAAILQDVVYLMSRSNDATETRVFFKIPSAGTRNIDVFTHAFPTTPYLFVYREPVQVIMSHFKDGVETAKCVVQRHTPPSSVVKTVQKYDTARVGTLAKALSSPDYCAAHLGSITETAVLHMTPFGTPINYVDLPASLYTDVLPYILNVPSLTDEQLVRMQAVATVYSKNRGGMVMTGSFESDSVKKERMASPEVRLAAATYLTPSFAALEALAAARQQERDQKRRKINIEE
jgi:hypothetical protein